MNYDNDFKVSSNVKNYVLIALILVGATLFYLFSGPMDVAIRIEDESVTLSGLDEQHTVTVAYADIIRTEIVDPLPELGEAVEIMESGKVVSGRCTSADYGEYWVFINRDHEIGLLMQTEEETVLFNIESAETTRELHKALLKYMDGSM